MRQHLRFVGIPGAGRMGLHGRWLWSLDGSSCFGHDGDLAVETLLLGVQYLVFLLKLDIRLGLMLSELAWCDLDLDTSLAIIDLLLGSIWLVT